MMGTGARRPRSVMSLVFVVGLALVAAACGGGTTTKTGQPSTGSTDKVQRGGVYRTAIEDFGFTGAFDPTGEYLGNAWGLYSEMLLRNLVTFKHVRGVAGDEIVPDLATDTGQVSADGLTYTFHLKSGLKWGPPLSRPITTKDILFAFQRIESAALVAQYGFYYDGTIVGMNGPLDKKAQDIKISGIETPDDSTVVFHLQKPTGDFLFRLALPAAAPTPAEVAGCFDKAGDYGRDVVSSGPYMIKGMDQVDASSCAAIKPASGFDPTKVLKLVRNPNYDASTDSPDVRANYIDGFVALIDSNTDDIFNKIETGELDGSWSSQPPPQTLQKYATDASLKRFFHSDPGDRTWYITMNLLVPPFDDIHVRKAVNYVINKSALQKAWGGPLRGQVATHTIPPTVLPGFPSDYNPYPSPNNSGDLNEAKNEMKQSKYDSNGDGLCDASVCKNVLFVNRTTPPFVNMTPTIQDDLSQIGIQVKARELDPSTAYTTIQTVKNLVPIAANAGWGKDYADPGTFAVLWDSSGINCEGQIDYAEVGMTEAEARKCGVLSQWQKAGGTGLPSVDGDFARCNGLAGQDRRSCWIDFDKNLMENVVPWVPYLWANSFTIISKSVTHYEYDQFPGLISFCHIAVSNGVSADSI
jgi:peptide/nickel transport system substrate-binding protein